MRPTYDELQHKILTSHISLPDDVIFRWLDELAQEWLWCDWEWDEYAQAR